MRPVTTNHLRAEFGDQDARDPRLARFQSSRTARPRMLVPRGHHIERTVTPLERATDTELDQLRQRLSKTARGGPRDAISLGLDRDLVQREVAELRSMIAVAEKTQFAERCSHLDPVTPPPTAPRQRSRFAVDVNSTAAGSLLTVTPPPSAPRLTPALNTPALSLGLLRSAMRDEQAEFDSSSRKLGPLRGSTSTSSLLSLRPETAPAMLIVGPHCVGRASSGYAGRYCTSPPPGGSASLVVNHVSDIQPRMFRSPSFASITSSSSLSGLSLSSRPGPPALTSALALPLAAAGSFGSLSDLGEPSPWTPRMTHLRSGPTSARPLPEDTGNHSSRPTLIQPIARKAASSPISVLGLNITGISAHSSAIEEEPWVHRPYTYNHDRQPRGKFR